MIGSFLFFVKILSPKIETNIDSIFHTKEDEYECHEGCRPNNNRKEDV